MNGYIKLRSLRRNPLRTAICAVMFLMAHDPESTFLAKTWPAYGAEESERIANMRCPGCGTLNGGRHSDNCSHLPPREEIARVEAFVANTRYSGPDRVRAQRAPEPLTAAELDVANGMIEVLRAKPKRIRVRGKPLTVADIVPGGVYVPKRGNDKTPNIVVRAIDCGATFADPNTVLYTRGESTETTRAAMPEFLALVSRKVTA